MNSQDTVDLCREAITECMIIAGPLLVAGLIIGLIVGTLQAMTQIHDQTVSFVPRLIGMCLVLALALPWLAGRMVDYSRNRFENPMIRVEAEGSSNGFPSAGPRSQPVNFRRDPNAVPATNGEDLVAGFATEQNSMPQQFSMPQMQTPSSSMPVMQGRTAPRVALQPDWNFNRNPNR